MAATPARLLTIAGSDSGGGAGIQADLKTFAAHRVYGMSVVTAVTAQNTRQVTAVSEIPAEVVTAQIDAVFDDIGVDGVKIGMLSSPAIVRAVAAGLRRHGAPKVVLDPVMVAKSGDALLRDEAVAAMLDELVPLVHLLTPNLPEAARLSGLPVETETQRREAAKKLAAAGPAVLVKGGHGVEEPLVDLLWQPVADAVAGAWHPDSANPAGAWHRFVHPRQATESTHGTGCTLSSAIAARWASGESLAAAVEGGIAYLQGALAAAYPIGQGHGPVNHLWNLED